jgi:hypothetical protein
MIINLFTSLRKSAYSKRNPNGSTRLAGGGSTLATLTSKYKKSCGRSRCRSQYPKVPTVFKTGLQAAAIHLPYLAEKEGFEPPVPFGTLVFKTSAISQTLPFLLCSLRRIRTLIS